MIRHVRRALAALAILALFAAPALAGAELVTILHVNDSHSHLDAVGPKDHDLDGTLGGLAKAATVVGRLRATAPNAIFVHAGDVFQGDLYFYAALGPGGTPLMAVPELQLLAGLGLDAMTVGNHELAYGAGTYAQVLGAAFQGAGPAVLSANIDLGLSGLSGLVRPNVVKEIGGVRVGFFGLTVIDALSQGTPFLDSTPDGLVQIALAQVADLRDVQHADVVVCLSHLGLDLEEVLARNVPRLDAIVGGHNHVTTPRPIMVAGPSGRRVPIVRAGDYYKWVGKLTLSVEHGRVSLAGFRLVPVDGQVERAPAVAAAVDQLKAGIDQLYGEDFWHQRIAFALADVQKDAADASPQRDTGIGNLITDALRVKGGTDIAMTVNGFFTEGLTRGPMVRDDAFRIVGDGIDPFGGGLGFPLFRIEIDGLNLLTALETTLAAGDDYFVQASGMRYVFDSRNGPGSRLVAAYVHGQPIDPARIYSATVNLGVVQGLAQLPGVQLASEPQPIGVTEYVAVRDWMTRLRLLLYFPQGRVLDLARR
jgi:5'-nucleotidase